MQVEFHETPTKPDEPVEAADREDTVRFDDPAWDDEYCTWLDNGLRTCCP